MRNITRERVWTWLGAVFLVGCAWAPTSGFNTVDTKLDLSIDPAAFLARTLQAWDPSASFGQMQNQAYGYLLPMGPFFWLGHEAHLPGWIVQRLWWSLLLVVAYSGMVLLARQLRIGTPRAVIVGAVLYALSPRIVGSMASISVESWPTALVPWMVLPLLTAVSTGRLRRGAARSAVVVGLMGGVNAAAVLATLPIGLLFVLTAARGTIRRRLLAWWVPLVGAACLWWIIPLLVLARYSYPFLDFIESASVTNFPTSLFNLTRGTDSWLAFMSSVTGRQPAGGWLSLAPVGIVATATAAVFGLWGLTRLSPQLRRWFVATTVLGIALMAVGYAGAAGSPISGIVQGFFDGVGAPLRNVHKFDVLIRFPLAFGVMAGIPYVVKYARELPSPKFSEQVGAEFARVLRATPAVLLGLLLLASTTPAWSAQIANSGYRKIPAAWAQAANAVEQHSDQGRALLVPGTSFADYQWGNTQDEPMQALGRSPWAVRDAIPLGAPGATRWMDGVDQLLATGTRQPDLAAQLSRAGITTVVLRNDLNPLTTPIPTATVRATLLSSPGLDQVGEFGKPIAINSTLSDGAVGGYTKVPPIEVFSVVTDKEADARLSVVPVSDVAALQGAAEALSTVRLDQAATVSPKDAELVGTDVTIGTDTNRRRALNTGAQVGRNYGPTVTADTDVSQGKAQADFTEDATMGQTVVTYSGLDSLSASSSTSDPFAIAVQGPATRAFGVFDGNMDSGWVADLDDKTPHITAKFPDPVGTHVHIVVPNRSPITQPTKLRVTSDSGDQVIDIPVGQREVDVDLGGKTRKLEITITDRLDRDRVTGLDEVRIEGANPTEQLTVPGEANNWVFARQGSVADACVLSDVFICGKRPARGDAEPVNMARVFQSSTDEQVPFALSVRPRSGAGLNALLDHVAGIDEIEASSSYSTSSAARPGAALDGLSQTAWTPEDSDVNPWLRITLPTSTTFNQLRITSPKQASTVVRSVSVTTDGKSESSELDKDGLAHFSSMTGRKVTISFTSTPKKKAKDIAGLSFNEVTLLNNGSAVTHPQASVSQDCSAGPTLTLDGQKRAFAVSGTVQDLLQTNPITAKACDTQPLSVNKGSNDLVVAASTAFTAQEVRLGSAVVGSAINADTGQDARSAAVDQWNADQRKVTVGSGSASLLIVNEGMNAGWQAQVDGTELTPVRVDGWKQAWIVPASSSPMAVTMDFSANNAQRWGLLVGMLCLLGVAVFAIRRGRSSPGSAVFSPVDAVLPSRLRAPAIAVLGILISGWVGAVCAAVALAVRRHALAIFIGGYAGAAAIGALTGQVVGSSVWAGIVQVLSLLGFLGWCWLALLPARSTGISHSGTLDEDKRDLSDDGAADKSEDGGQHPASGEVVLDAH